MKNIFWSVYDLNHNYIDTFNTKKAALKCSKNITAKTEIKKQIR